MTIGMFYFVCLFVLLLWTFFEDMVLLCSLDWLGAPDLSASSSRILGSHYGHSWMPFLVYKFVSFLRRIAEQIGFVNVQTKCGTTSFSKMLLLIYVPNS
jgi:hypothetical protein